MEPISFPVAISAPLFCGILLWFCDCWELSWRQGIQKRFGLRTSKGCGGNMIKLDVIVLVWIMSSLYPCTVVCLTPMFNRHNVHQTHMKGSTMTPQATTSRATTTTTTQNRKSLSPRQRIPHQDRLRGTFIEKRIRMISKCTTKYMTSQIISKS